MSTSGNLAQQRDAMRRVLAGESVEDAALALSVKPDTVVRWLSSPSRRSEIAARLTLALDVAAAAALAAMPGRVAWLARVADGTEQATPERVDAALALVHLGRALADLAMPAPLPEFNMGEV